MHLTKVFIHYRLKLLLLIVVSVTPRPNVYGSTAPSLNQPDPCTLGWACLPRKPSLKASRPTPSTTPAVGNGSQQWLPVYTGLQLCTATCPSPALWQSGMSAGFQLCSQTIILICYPRVRDKY